MTATTRDAIREQLKKDGIEYVLVQFVDIHGAAKCKMVPVETLDDVADVGAGFAGAAVWGMGQGPHSHDMMARIDLASYTPLPWKPGVARFASDIHVDGKPYDFCARVNLKRVLDDARKQGYVFNVGVEPEHFLVVRRENGEIAVWDPHAVDSLSKPCYDFKGMCGAIDYLREMNDGLKRLGWGVYQSDHEDANAQYEINFKYADALTSADRFTFFKMMASQVAAKYGAIATFMAKPFSDRTGSGAHMHYHIADAATGKNLCVYDAATSVPRELASGQIGHKVDGGDLRGLGHSVLGYHFIGGVLAHARALCAITSPTVNCYKRLQIGARLYSPLSGYTWTPAFITYGDNNRTQMIRCPEGGHFEDRTVSGGMNPYLAFAAYLTAGLDGIQRRLDPGEPNISNMYQTTPAERESKKIRLLPQSLPEALAELERDQVVQSALGPIYNEFITLKKAEWTDYHAQVGRWEVERYLTMF